MTRKWPNPQGHSRRSFDRRILADRVAFGDQMMRDAIIMAMYIRGMDRPVFLDKDIEHVKRTFNVELEAWEREGSHEPLP